MWPFHPRPLLLWPPARASQAQVGSVAAWGFVPSGSHLSNLTCFNLFLLRCFIVNAQAHGAEKSGTTNPYLKKKVPDIFPPSSSLEIILNFNSPLGQWTWVMKMFDLIHKCRWTERSTIPRGPSKTSRAPDGSNSAEASGTGGRQAAQMFDSEGASAQRCRAVGLSHRHTQFSLAAVETSIFP